MSIYRLTVNSKNSLTAMIIRTKLPVSTRRSEYFDDCMIELKADGLIIRDSETALWMAAQIYAMLMPDRSLMTKEMLGKHELKLVLFRSCLSTATIIQMT